MLSACAHDFALVGTAALVLQDASVIDSCKNSRGQAIGIPNMVAAAFVPLACDKDTFLISQQQTTYCATRSLNPQTFTVNSGAFGYLRSRFGSLHGILMYSGTTAALKLQALPSFQAANIRGIKSDAQGTYPVATPSPQSAFDSEMQIIKNSGSSFVFMESTLGNMVEIRSEAQQQGVSSVKAWFCSSGCYDPLYASEGGSATNDTYVSLSSLNFLTDYKSNPALATLVAKVGGVKNLDATSFNAFVSALLLQDVANKVVAGRKVLNRASLFAALRGEHSFNGGGLIGTTDVGHGIPSPCYVLVKLTNGVWHQTYPAKTGTFDCRKTNLTEVKMNLH